MTLDAIECAKAGTGEPEVCTGFPNFSKQHEVLMKIRYKDQVYDVIKRQGGDVIIRGADGKPIGLSSRDYEVVHEVATPVERPKAASPKVKKKATRKAAVAGTKGKKASKKGARKTAKKKIKM